MKLKLDAEGHVVAKDGQPIYVHDDGKEIAFDAPAALQKISQLGNESKGRREALDTAEAKTAFDEQLRAIEEKYKPVIKERNELRAEIVAEKVGNTFSRSKYIAESLAVPVDMVQATFGRNFKLEDGNVIGYGRDGKPLFSPLRPGEVADFDEALEIMVDAYPHKDIILKSSGANGGGAGGGNGKGNIVTRAAFDQPALDNPTEAAKVMANVRAGTVKLVDNVA